MTDLSKELRERLPLLECLTADRERVSTDALIGGLYIATALMARAADALEWKPIADAPVFQRVLAIGIDPVIKENRTEPYIVSFGPDGKPREGWPYVETPTHFMHIPQPPEDE